MAPRSRRIFKFRRVTEDELAEVRDFHLAHLTEHLYPRTLADLQDFVTNESIFALYETTGGVWALVGMCYVSPQDEGKPWEFGGIFLVESCRGLGLAAVMGKACLINQMVMDHVPLIAHVHEANPKPRRLLVDELGFVRDGEEEMPAAVAPASMARNADGKVIGHLFRFKDTALAKFADWLERFSGQVGTATDAPSVALATPALSEERENTIATLRSLAVGGPHRLDPVVMKLKGMVSRH